MNQPLISVIVPIYKVEKYLDRCVESIVNQTYRNLEIILVDDGSPDNCPQICDNWAEKDNRIMVVHKKNEGAGKARNIGLNTCKGEFVSFVDSDDYISKNFLNKLYSCFNETIDIAECEYDTVTNNEYCFNEIETASMICDNESALKFNIYDKLFKQVIWNKLYRKSVIAKNRFPEKYKIDDEFWTYRVIANCNNLIHINSKLYAYRQQQSSVMHNLTIDQRRQPIIAKEEKTIFIHDRFHQLYPDCVYSLLCSCMYQTQMVYRFGNKNEKKEFISYTSVYFRKYKLERSFLKKLEFKCRIWIKLSYCSLPLTCYIRNVFKIGL